MHIVFNELVPSLSYDFLFALLNFSETGELWRSLGRDASLALLILPKLASRITKPTDSGTILHFTNEDIVEFAEEDPLKVSGEEENLDFFFCESFQEDIRDIRVFFILNDS